MVALFAIKRRASDYSTVHLENNFAIIDTYPVTLAEIDIREICVRTTKILNPNILETDAVLSNASIDHIKQYVEGPDRSLEFFVGAGASMAGNTNMPSTPSLIYQLLWDSLVFSGAFDSEAETYKHALSEICSALGFEITLNDFWQICHEATVSIYTSFAELEGKCATNRVHAFLAHWLATKGTVVTTNYDRLIEREWEKTSRTTKSLFGESAPNSYATWRKD